MPFWKKSEDPWDYEPEKRPVPSAEAGGGEDAPGFFEELRGDLQKWNQERKEKKAQRQTPPPPMKCPWCGQEMEVGYVTSGRVPSGGGPAGPQGLAGRGRAIPSGWTTRAPSSCGIRPPTLPRLPQDGAGVPGGGAGSPAGHMADASGGWGRDGHLSAAPPRERYT